jgi:hypothetical protein
MSRPARFLASAVTGGFIVLAIPMPGRAQSTVRSPVGLVFAPGSILGIVQDETGAPVGGVVVSALGATMTSAVTASDGKFAFGPLVPGPYLVRAHLSGYAAPRAQTVQVRASVSGARATIELRRASASVPILAAGMTPVAARDEAPVSAVASNDADTPPGDDHRETVWRMRHARRGVLKDLAIADVLVADDDAGGRPADTFLPGDFSGGTVGSTATAARSFFIDTPFSGQVNLLATGTFDMPQQLFSADSMSRNIAFVRLGAAVGERADWTVSGALAQADISSWIVAGAYTTRAPERHAYSVGLSYSTQRYDGGHPLALRDVAVGSRNAGTIYAYDSFAVTRSVTVAYGAAYARYDYLDTRNLLSPRVEVTVTPVEKLRISAEVSQRALAPGAEEFLPPGDTGIWLPPQRTFSSVDPEQPFEAERTTHMAMVVERDFGASTIAVRAFRQRVNDQLVAVFGQELPDHPSAQLGHYLVGNGGEATAAGWRGEFRTVIGGRVRGSVAYSVANARLAPAAADLRYVVLLTPSAVRPFPERLHDLSTTVETTVPETATRVLMLYRVSNGFVRTGITGDTPALDGRFDVQVRQSLPFMNFSNARWEMLLGVRNFFREGAADQSLFDELLVVRPPKRVVGGVTLHF